MRPSPVEDVDVPYPDADFENDDSDSEDDDKKAVPEEQKVQFDMIVRATTMALKKENKKLRGEIRSVMQRQDERIGKCE